MGKLGSGRDKYRKKIFQNVPDSEVMLQFVTGSSFVSLRMGQDSRNIKY